MKKVLILIFLLTIFLLKDANAQDLIGYWKFDEGSGSTTSDSSGYGNDGTLYGSLSAQGWTNDCIFGSCLKFNGETDYVAINKFGDFSDGFTIELWFNMKENIKDQLLFHSELFITCGAGSNGSTSMVCYMGNGTGNVKSHQTSGWSYNSWTHFAMTYDTASGDWIIYRNGTSVGTKSYDDVMTMLDDFGIGANFWSAGCQSVFNGTIDEVKIYNRALTADEIYADYIGDGTTTSTTTTSTTTLTTITTTTITTTTSTTTTIPAGQVSILGQLKNTTDPIQADIIIYNQGTSQVNTSDTTTDGNYVLTIWPGIYDLQFNILEFFIPSFWIKLISLNVVSDLQDVVNYVTGSSENITFTVNITTDQEIQVYSEDKPKTVEANGVELTEATLPLSTNEWFYDSIEKRLYLIVSLVLPTTTTTVTTTVFLPTTTTTVTTTVLTTTSPPTTTTTVPPRTFMVGFENSEDFEIPEDPTTGYVWACQTSWWSCCADCSGNPDGYKVFEPATDIVHSGNQSARLKLINPVDDKVCRIHIYHQWDTATYEHLWYEAWYYLPTDFVVDDWTHIHAALSERTWNSSAKMGYQPFGIGLGLTQGSKVADDEYKLETILNHGWVDNNDDGVDDLVHNYYGDWRYSTDTIKFGEWFKIKTYLYRNMSDFSNGIYTMWINDNLEWNFTSVRTIGITPEIIDALPKTGGGNRGWIESGMSLYTNEGGTPKEIRVDDVILSNQPEI